MDTEQFFTFQSITSIGGASLAAIAVTNALYKALGWKQVLVCFISSVVIVLAVAFESGALKSIGGVVIALINACLLFSTATGMQEFTAGALSPKPVGTAKPYGAKDRRILDSWTSR